MDGLVHVSNISDKRLNSPADVLKIGDVVQAKVIKFENNRMALSIKDAQEPAETTESTEGGEKRVRTSARPTQEKRGKKPATDEISKEEQEIVENFGAAETVQNNVLGDLLKGFKPSDDNN